MITILQKQNNFTTSVELDLQSDKNSLFKPLDSTIKTPIIYDYNEINFENSVINYGFLQLTEKNFEFWKNDQDDIWNDV